MASWFVTAKERSATQPTYVKVGAVLGGAVVGAVAGVVAAPAIGAAASLAVIDAAGTSSTDALAVAVP